MTSIKNAREKRPKSFVNTLLLCKGAQVDLIDQIEELLRRSNRQFGASDRSLRPIHFDKNLKNVFDKGKRSNFSCLIKKRTFLKDLIKYGQLLTSCFAEDIDAKCAGEFYEVVFFF